MVAPPLRQPLTQPAILSHLALAALVLALRAGLAAAAPDALGAPAARADLPPPAYAPLQPASNTATPRITLPTWTPPAAARGTATAAGPTATRAPFAVVTDVPAAGTPLDSTPGGGAPAGSAVAPVPLGTAADPGIAPPALPGGAGGGTGTAAGAPGGESGGAAEAAGGGTPPASADPARALPADPRVRAVWATAGPPRQGQGWFERFTAERPGPWGWWPFYLVVLAAWGWVMARAWRAVRAVGDSGGDRWPDGGHDAGGGAADSGGVAEP